MEQVKVFYSDNEDAPYDSPFSDAREQKPELENKINNWIRENKHVAIQRVVYAASGAYSHRVSCIIFYITTQGVRKSQK